MKSMSIIVLLMVTLLAACGNAQNTDHSGMKHGGEHGEASDIEPKDVNAVWTFDDEKPMAGKEIGLNIQVQNNDNKPIENFDAANKKSTP